VSVLSSRQRIFKINKLLKEKMEHEKEIKTLSLSTTRDLDQAKEIKILTTSDSDDAQEILTNLSKRGKAIEEKKRSILNPINEAAKKVRDLFRIPETQNSDAILLVKNSLEVYYRKLEELETKKKAEVEAKLKTGEMSFEKASNVLGKVEEKKGAISTRIERKVVIKDKSKLPIEYLEPNMVLIRKDVLFGGKKIPGVEIEESKIMITPRS